jgi:signal transduction histidine kinase
MRLRVAPRSLRGRFLLVVLLGAVLPLALVGWRLARSGMQSAEELLGSQLDTSLAAMVRVGETRWSDIHADLLLLAGNEVVSRTLASASAPVAADSAYMRQLLTGVSPAIASVEYVARGGQHRWALPTTVAAPRTPSPNNNGLVRNPEPAIVRTLPVRAPNGAQVGALTARVRLADLLASDLEHVGVFDAALGVADARTNAAVIASPEGTLSSNSRRFVRDGETWLSARARVDGPDIVLTIAAPTRSYVKPFQRAARVGLLALLVVALLVAALSVILTARLTRSLEQLALAASAVAAGDLQRSAEAGGAAEIAQVASAFNVMTENLRRMLGQLSQRQALAAVGEFAASLAHEVRNALTAVKIDLQRAEEKADPASPVSPIVARALSNTRRLDRTVTNALRLARSARVARAPVDLCDVACRAALGAESAFTAARAELRVDVGDSPMITDGDALALEQLALNLLLNAAHAVSAVSPHGRATIRCRRGDDGLHLEVEDNGSGIPPHDLPRVTDPFFSTKNDGTGLGLSIAKQIAMVHGGSLRIESEEGKGTLAAVALPVG